MGGIPPGRGGHIGGRPPPCAEGGLHVTMTGPPSNPHTYLFILTLHAIDYESSEDEDDHSCDDHYLFHSVSL